MHLEVEGEPAGRKTVDGTPRAAPLATAIAMAPVAALAAESALAPELRAPTDLQLFLVLGLPNLPRRGKVEKIDRELHERVLLMNKGFGWTRSIDPDDWSEPELAHVELAAALARMVVNGRPDVMVGLIPSAFGGSELADWMPGGALYKGAVERTRIAQKDGNLVGILWYQGPTKEDPSKGPDYAKKFAAMIAQLRVDLRIKFVPVVVGELKLGATGLALATALNEVPQQVLPCFFVSSAGLRTDGDNTHLDSDRMWEFTERFSRAWMDLAQP
ncbi:MAG: sialate O-acetylesterase [Opitutaceae bacterium]